MEWQQFHYFKTLARIQHVTRSAEELSITQSALSRSIARFEDEIGVPLFERQGRSIRLNEYGHIFLKRVDRILKEFSEGKQEIYDLLEPDQGQVSIGFLHTLSTNVIPELIASFRTHYPKITFKLGQGSSPILLEQLQLGGYDLCLVAPANIKSPIQWKELWSERLFVTVPKEHKFANFKSITLEEIADEPFILLKKGYSLRTTIERLFEDMGISPKITFEGDEADTVVGLVAAGLGISILPNMKGIDQSKISQLSIDSPQSRRTIGLAEVQGRYLSPATRQFKQFVFDYFGKSE
ncbi:LysR family transcriptional regulator [Bacillus sp. SD088]|uniref:LysR family transcriptional regulator n=1 Tax=Bacillus sp. SD088 TaxID=2782012 RepID=UPI001A962C94|nr:LysR family transcriptional regulator [Bacillus sp. SD088]MBO0994929.1 LysR family transcriptional regulator [Bacillus sp. SD088]